MKRKVVGFILLACFLVAACVGAYDQLNDPSNNAPSDTPAVEQQAE